MKIKMIVPLAPASGRVGKIFYLLIYGMFQFVFLKTLLSNNIF